jgi:hypothetical protein
MMTLVAFLVAAWLVYELAKYSASLIRYDENWLARSFYKKLNAIGFTFMANNFLCAGLNFLIPTPIVFFIWIIAPTYHFWTRREYKKSLALEQAIKEFETRQQIAALEERRTNVIKLEVWFDSAPDWYYPAERDGFFHWLEEQNEFANFHDNWDEYLRLHTLGLISGRTCICHLDHLTYAQKQARGDLAWKRIVQARQGNTKAPKNESGAHTNAPTEKQLRKKEERLAADKQRSEEEDQRYLEELRERGIRDKAAYRLQR